MPATRRPILAAAVTLCAGGLLAAGCGPATGVPLYRDPATVDARPEDNEALLGEPADVPTGAVTGTGEELPYGDPADAPARPPLDPLDGGDVDPILPPPPADSGARTPPPPSREPQAGAGAESAGYRTVGGVMGEVNGRAIFTDDVIGARARELRGQARTLPPDEFVRAAESILAREFGQRLQDELALVVFERYARADERARASAMTTAWRLRTISDHGGSEAAARRAVRAETGKSFEAVARDVYRQQLAATFLDKLVKPLIRPTVAELRAAYYAARDAGELTRPGEVEFSLIEVRPDSADPTSQAAARNRARELLARAQEPAADFAGLARLNSDNAAYADRGGRPPESLLPLAPGVYAVVEVDDAAWVAPVGEVHPEVIESGEGEDLRLYILKVDARRDEETADFEQAQGLLSARLQNERQQELIAGYIDAERGRLDLPTEEQQRRMLQTAMEVVTQNYDAWRAEG